MQIKFNGETEDISMMLVSAERYALGRSCLLYTSDAADEL